MKLTVNPWDPSSIKLDRNLVCIGKRGSGKSALLQFLLRCLHHLVDVVMGMCPTINSQRMLRQHIPDSLIFDEGYTREQMIKFITIFKALLEGKKTRHGLAVLDDCNADRKQYCSQEFTDLFFNGRQYNIFTIIALQYVMSFPPTLRTQIDYVFLFAEKSVQTRRKLYDNFGGMFATFQDFSCVFDSCTGEHECMVLDNTRSGALSDTVFYFRAPYPCPGCTCVECCKRMRAAHSSPYADMPFLMCRPAYWELHRKYGKKSVSALSALLLPPVLGSAGAGAGNSTQADRQHQQQQHQGAEASADTSAGPVDILATHQHSHTSAMNPRIEHVVKRGKV